MKRERDNLRSAVYSVEDMLTKAMEAEVPLNFFGSMLDLPVMVRFAQVSDTVKVVNRVWDIEVGDGNPPRVRVRKGETKATYTAAGHTIALPNERWSLTLLVLLHELGHAVVRYRYGFPAAAHGVEWRKEYVHLVRKYMSPEAALVLTSGFDHL